MRLQTAIMGEWTLSHRADPRAALIADRHYNRQHIGAPQFVPPGRCVVLLLDTFDALWVSSWPFAEYTKHAWAGAWVCSCFRNESPRLSSELITEAVAMTRAVWGDPPPLGMVTFVDPTKVRHKRDFGRCYRRAGWQEVGKTKVVYHAPCYLHGGYFGDTTATDNASVDYSVNQSADVVNQSSTTWEHSLHYITRVLEGLEQP